MAYTVEVGDEGYQLVGPSGEESGVTDYGDTAEVEVDGKTIVTTVDSAQEALAEPPQLFLLLDEVAGVEEIEFVMESDEDDEDADDEEDEGEGSAA